MTGGIVLAGGASLRMGRDKAALDWHGVPLLAHVCAVVRRGIGGGPVVAVGAPGRPLPPLPAWVATAVDSRVGIGPMQGLLDGLRALPQDVDAVFLASTDAPLLCPALVETTLAALRAGASLDAAIPYVRGHRHPLLAAYRAGARDLLESGLLAGRRRAGHIFEGRLRLLSETELLAAPALRRQDPGLRSVDDADTPERYTAALGLAAPTVSLVADGAARPARAFRLSELVPLAGRPVERLRVEGACGPPFALLPLAEGDVVRCS